jgi:D-alanyl-lipoteichoic acid acyltransferase DltB (MBOAT superfamily)
MLFNSYIFIFAFLPLALAGFFLLGRLRQKEYALGFLTAASLFYYGWWNPVYLWLIIFSMIFNYALGVRLGRHAENEKTGNRILLWLGIAINLGFLGYYKYANFFADNLNALFGANFALGRIILPLAISFFTFQQIAYLVDAYRGETREYNFIHYCLFVVYFPQLIAGPIVHHKEMLPQFAGADIYRPRARWLGIGLTLFVLGLAKKVILADGVARFATPVFTAADAGEALTLVEAWTGLLAYTFQIYFDFSGYSDMAIGLGAMIGIRLPLNFNSPYKAVNIIDFWRRWHITLSRFLRDYLYISLGGNRHGKARRHVNLMLTMLLGGLWHGAGWSFVIWGGLHGAYLAINHGWHAVRKKHHGGTLPALTPGWAWTSRTLTLLAVMLGWVFFRAGTLGGASGMLRGLLGGNGLALPAGYLDKLGGAGQAMANVGVQFREVPLFCGIPGLLLLAGLFLIVWFLPNTQEIFGEENVGIGEREPLSSHWRWLRWRPAIGWALLAAGLSLYAVYRINEANEFLYYQF